MDTTIEDSRDRARVTEHHIENTAYTKYPGNYYGKNDEWNPEDFKRNFRAEVISYHSGRELEIDLVGIGPAIANAYRRIILAEVPSMAIEQCIIHNNTSVIQDEMLAHRMGMIPIRADPTKFAWNMDASNQLRLKPECSISFTLKAKCEKLPESDPDKTGRREDLYKDYKVFSSHLEWKPRGKQAMQFTGKEKIRPVHKGILIAKLSGKQEIDLELNAVKGIGRDHAKFSPVATVSYRLLPEIKLKQEMNGASAVRLKESFSGGVIEIQGRDKSAKVVNARIDSGSRNVFRHADLKDKVIYDLIKDHFIFTIESTGAIAAIDILLQACDILDFKCNYFLDQLESSRSRVDEFAPVVEGI